MPFYFLKWHTFTPLLLIGDIHFVNTWVNAYEYTCTLLLVELKLRGYVGGKCMMSLSKLIAQWGLVGQRVHMETLCMEFNVGVGRSHCSNLFTNFWLLEWRVG